MYKSKIEDYQIKDNLRFLFGTDQKYKTCIYLQTYRTYFIRKLH